MPTGKVKWYDSDKGSGFLARDAKKIAAVLRAVADDIEP